MDAPLPTIVVLGASGLIGEAVARQLAAEGFPVVPVARRFSAAQRAAFGTAAIEAPLVGADDSILRRLLGARTVDVVLNCVGVLQDGPRGHTAAVHAGFVRRMLAALAAGAAPALLVHVSIPGNDADDRTPFSRTKREAERLIAAAPGPFVILRPGFVVAPAAYGGGALLRALAALPLDLPARDAAQLFATTDTRDIARTVAVLAARWRDGKRDWRAAWDVMAPEKTTVGDVVGALRAHLGGPARAARLPRWAMDAGARLGDLAARLGWSPPIRTTALREMRRGVAGDPSAWIAATGIDPATLPAAIAHLPSTVQERWFARLYLCKPLLLASLAVFWAASGLIALTFAFRAAAAILLAHGFPPSLAAAVTVVSSLIDIAVGLAIACRRTCRAGLLAGIVVSLGYMVGAAVLTPDLWIEPLGALVKTGPAIVLMVVALATLEER